MIEDHTWCQLHGRYSGEYCPECIVLTHKKTNKKRRKSNKKR